MSRYGINLRWFTLSLFLFSLLLTPSAMCSVEQNTDLLTFRALPLAGLHSGQPGTYSIMASWDPEYKFNEKWKMNFDFGFSVYRQTTLARFGVFEFELLGSYEFAKPWSVEFGGGGQSWLSLGTGPMVTANAKYALNKKLLRYIDEVIVGYSAVFQGTTYHFIHIGIGIKL